MLAPAVPYADLAARLLALQVQAALAYVAHSRDRGLVDGAWFKLWAAAYEARAAIGEQNPAWASGFLSLSTQPTALLPVGVPVVPTGVRVGVDEPTAGKVTVSIDVAGPVTLTVRTPGGTPATGLTVAPTPTRVTAIFNAPADGIYEVGITVGGVRLTTLYLLVCRHEFALFRELSRYLAYAFRDTLPRPIGTYPAFLARLIGAEAAVKTGQPALAARLLASVRALPKTPRPTGVYPYPRCK